MRVTISGDFAALLRADLRRGEKAVTRAVRSSADKLKLDMRNQVTGAGLGGRLANAVRSRNYPPGSDASLGAAALVYAKPSRSGVGGAAAILSAYEDGAVIRSRQGRYLAIPTDAVISRGGKKVSPRDFEEAGIKLRFVPPRAGRPALLVADDFTVGERSGRARYATARQRQTGRRLATVVMFVLIPQARVRKRLNIKSLADSALSSLPNAIVSEWEGGNG